MKRRCENCECWKHKPIPGDDQSCAYKRGECRRYPGKNNDTSSDYWCGEFKPRDTEGTQPTRSRLFLAMSDRELLDETLALCDKQQQKILELSKVAESGKARIAELERERDELKKKNCDLAHSEADLVAGVAFNESREKELERERDELAVRINGMDKVREQKIKELEAQNAELQKRVAELEGAKTEAPALEQLRQDILLYRDAIAFHGCGGRKISTPDGDDFDCDFNYPWDCDDCPCNDEKGDTDPDYGCGEFRPRGTVNPQERIAGLERERDELAKQINGMAEDAEKLRRKLEKETNERKLMGERNAELDKRWGAQRKRNHELEAENAELKKRVEELEGAKHEAPAVDPADGGSRAALINWARDIFSCLPKDITWLVKNAEGEWIGYGGQNTTLVECHGTWHNEGEYFPFFIPSHTPRHWHGDWRESKISRKECE